MSVAKDLALLRSVVSTHRDHAVTPMGGHGVTSLLTWANKFPEILLANLLTRWHGSGCMEVVGQHGTPGGGR